jgi:signal transduction histidine kinase
MLIVLSDFITLLNLTKKLFLCSNGLPARLKCFNWFQRKTTSTKSHGTGMGLAIVKEIAALHGGDVWLEPAKPKGVTFCVSLSRHLIPMEEGGQD